MRTLSPATTAPGAIGTETVVDHGAIVPKPSSAFIATRGSRVSSGFATGILRVRSPVPDSSRSVGNGTTPLLGSNCAVNASSGGGVVSSTGGEELPPPLHAARVRVAQAATKGIQRT